MSMYIKIDWCVDFAEMSLYSFANIVIGITIEFESFSKFNLEEYNAKQC